MPASVPSTFVIFAGVAVGMSVTFVPGTLVQISCTTELPVLYTVIVSTDAPTPVRLLDVSVALKVPASVGMPLMTPLGLLNDSPGGSPLAVKPNGVFAPVTVKLNGCPRNATALNALVTTDAALDVPLT